MSHKIKFLLTTLLCFFSLSCFANQQLIIEPNDGSAPILKLIDNAKQSITIVMYGFTNRSILNALINREDTGVKVKIILQPEPYKAARENTSTINTLKKHHVAIYEPNPNYQLTHQKSMVIDNKLSVIMTFNFTYSSFKSQRNFALISDDPTIAKAIIDTFNSDIKRTPTKPSNKQLLWSPNNSAIKLRTLLASTKSNLDIYAQSITDYNTIGQLSSLAKQGMKVHLLLPQQASQENCGKLTYLLNHGIKIHLSKAPYIHAKVIIKDNEEAYIGSMNLTKPSIYWNRELGIITEEKEVISSLAKTFTQDWNNSQGMPACMTSDKTSAQQYLH